MSISDDDTQPVAIAPPVAPPAAAALPLAPPPPYAPTPLRPGPGPTVVTELKSGPGMAIRALWFVVVGWWLTAIVSAIAWAAMVTLIGLPVGIYLVNRIPTVLTLRPRTSYRYQYTDELGRLVDVQAPIEQPAWYIRFLWFIVVGWWASAIAMTVGWVLIVLLITMPIGLMIYNRVPFVASLVRY
jgi:uncharacterized membrane protein YccF (DUF307 family)